MSEKKCACGTLIHDFINTCFECTPPPVPVENVISLDDYRKLEDIVKREMGCTHVVFLGVTKDQLYPSYIPSDIFDIDLVYLIQILIDRRIERLQ